MRFTLQMYWDRPNEGTEPSLSPLTLNFSSYEEALGVFGQVTRHAAIPVQSLIITSEDGVISVSVAPAPQGA